MIGSKYCQMFEYDMANGIENPICDSFALSVEGEYEQRSNNSTREKRKESRRLRNGSIVSLKHRDMVIEIPDNRAV
jgi:hypothetical protein